MIFLLCTWFDVWAHADIVRVGNRNELVISTIAACFGHHHLAHRLGRHPPQQPLLPRRVHLLPLDMFRAARHPGLHRPTSGATSTSTARSTSSGGTTLASTTGSAYRTSSTAAASSPPSSRPPSHRYATRAPCFPVARAPTWNLSASCSSDGTRSSLGSCRSRSRHHRRPAVLEPHHVPLRKGLDAQGIPTQHELDGRHHGQLC
jgi:hypothetical protein